MYEILKSLMSREVKIKQSNSQQYMTFSKGQIF